MSQKRSMTTALENALLASEVFPLVLVHLDFPGPGGQVRVWNGIGDLSWDSQTWKGLGSLGNIGDITETEEIRSNNLTLTLSGVPSDSLRDFLSTRYHNRHAKVYVGAFSAGSIVADPVLMYNALMDTAAIDESGETSSITLSCENRLIDLNRPRNRRRTHQDQRIEYHDDTGLEYTAGLVAAELYWGRPGPSPIQQTGNYYQRPGYGSDPTEIDPWANWDI